MQSILSKGNTINEAISVGLEILETSRDKVNIEIIEQGARGLLGIGSKKSIVRLTKVEMPTSSSTIKDLLSEMMEVEQNIETLSHEESSEKIEEESLEGKVWISNGRIQYKASSSHFPTITIQKGIRVFKNNVPVDEETIVISDHDQYEMEGENQEIETKWKVSLDKEKLKAQLTIEPGYRIIRKIPDMEPDNHLEIIPIEEKEINNTLSFQNILHKMSELGIKKGIKKIQILKAIESKSPSIFEIANGLAPQEGSNGWVELKVEVEMQQGTKEREDGKVDFRETMTIPNVEKGKVIGIIHPPFQGESGYTVTDEIIPSNRVYPIIFIAGTGVVKVVDKIVATQSGRPFIERRGQLVRAKIFQKLTHKGNVDLSSGNIRFAGDIEILGEVENNMVVEAEGDIYVRETVTNASLTSSGAIRSNGSIIGSEVSAGKNNILVAELGHQLTILNKQVENIISVIKQLLQTSAFKSNDLQKGGIQPLVRILLEKRYKNFPGAVKRYIEMVRRGEKFLEDENWRSIGVSLSKYFITITNEATSLEEFIQLSKKMQGLIEIAHTPVEPNSYITISNTLNSKLYCSGNISVTGQGCVNTKIHAGGLLKITGILRGGEVYGRMGVEVNASGAESASSTLITVPSDQKIRIKKAMEGTIIKIGTVTFTFKETKYNIVAYLNNEGRIVFQ
ncbi:FapA family protein [Robertmurraya korlensis]|uniref:FapA family protein n=1 Tax=Robertmurraya korlensis TaxID=519977 RepID=UPI000826CDFC|nr:FapA family protein [Robertmurraya korlensis]